MNITAADFERIASQKGYAVIAGDDSAETSGAETRGNKYNAQRCEVDGVAFDSKREAERYTELRWLEISGEIERLELQPAFTLLEPFNRNGRKIRGVRYVADFSYWQNGRRIVEDVKGVRTQVYIVKSKWFMFLNPDIEFKEVR